MKRLCPLIIMLASLPILVGCGVAVPDSMGVAGDPARPAVAATPALTPRASQTSIPVLNVKAKTVSMAKWRLESAGFKVKVKWTDGSTPRGRVIAQTPSGGTALPGRTIMLTVSRGPNGGPVERSFTAPSTANEDAAARAFRQRVSGIRLIGEGVVTRVLTDDNSGGRHQRFILRLSSGQTLLVAHNIDIAPRLMSLAPGDDVGFNGVYEWNSQGGTVHWTHHDPSGGHPDGWLKYNGKTIQ